MTLKALWHFRAFAGLDGEGELLLHAIAELGTST